MSKNTFSIFIIAIMLFSLFFCVACNTSTNSKNYNMIRTTDMIVYNIESIIVEISNYNDERDKDVASMRLKIKYVKTYLLDPKSPLQKLPDDVILWIAINESGLKKNPQNNYFGLLSKSGKLITFASTEKCILFFLENFEKNKDHYHELIACLEKNNPDNKVIISSIARAYAPENPNYNKSVIRVMEGQIARDNNNNPSFM